VPRFWATSYLAQASASRLSEKSRVVRFWFEHLAQARGSCLSENSCLTLCFCLTRRLGKILVLGEGRSRLGEKSSPKRDFAVSHWSMLAQARKLSLSETGLVAQAKAFSPSDYSAFCVH